MERSTGSWFINSSSIKGFRLLKPTKDIQIGIFKFKYKKKEKKITKSHLVTIYLKFQRHLYVPCKSKNIKKKNKKHNKTVVLWTFEYINKNPKICNKIFSSDRNQ